MALVSQHSPISLANRKQVPYWKAAIPLLLGAFMFCAVGPRVETLVWPVISDVSIVAHTDTYPMKFRLAFIKTRNCERLATIWRAGTPQNPVGAAFITLPSQQMAVGEGATPDIQVQLDPETSPTFYGLTRFKCPGIPWVTWQPIGPFNNWLTPDSPRVPMSAS